MDDPFTTICLSRYGVLLKLFLGILDVALDFISGFALISGQFALGFYFTTQNKEDYENALDVDKLGWLVLSLPFLSGLAYIAFVAVEESWKGVPVMQLAKRIVGYALALLVWPIFPNIV